MGITLADNLRPLTRGPLTIHDRGITAPRVVWDPRIGIRVGTDQIWRATVRRPPCVSGKTIRNLANLGSGFEISGSALI